MTSFSQHPIRWLAALLLFGGLLASSSVSAADKKSSAKKKNRGPRNVRVYVGTYTKGESKGIYQFSFDTRTGKAGKVSLAAETPEPSFLAIHPDGKHVVAVNETAEWEGLENSGGISAFEIDSKTGELILMNQQPTRGAHPCHLVIDSSGKTVLVANYTGGSVIGYSILDDGCLGEASVFVQHKGSSLLKPRQASPHAHSINIDPSGQFAVAADLGMDQVLVYKFDATKGPLMANKPTGTKVVAGAGPRHFSFHPNGRFGYVINEINLTVTAFAWNAKAGTFKEIQTISTLPPGEKRGKGMSTAEVRVGKRGRVLFGYNRGHDTIVSYKIDRKTGKLTYVGNYSTGGKTPRNFGLDPSGRFLLSENQDSGTIHVLKINRKTGQLDETGSVIKVPSPVCVRMLAIDPAK
ncbi:MAG: lactonase family protein [Planctomycetota bacterium]|nr:lactonase family protein [Planctomycetota bacterium]